MKQIFLYRKTDANNRQKFSDPKYVQAIGFRDPNSTPNLSRNVGQEYMCLEADSHQTAHVWLQLYFGTRRWCSTSCCMKMKRKIDKKSVTPNMSKAIRFRDPKSTPKFSKKFLKSQKLDPQNRLFFVTMLRRCTGVEITKKKKSVVIGFRDIGFRGGARTLNPKPWSLNPEPLLRIHNHWIWIKGSVIRILGY